LTRNYGKIESKIPQLRDFSKLRGSFVLTPFLVEMAAAESEILSFPMQQPASKSAHGYGK